MLEYLLSEESLMSDSISNSIILLRVIIMNTISDCEYLFTRRAVPSPVASSFSVLSQSCEIESVDHFDCSSSGNL